MIFMKIGKRQMAAVDLSQAVVLWEEIRDRHCYETGNNKIAWPVLYKEDGKTIIGYMSWNGRIWDTSPKKWSKDSKEIFATNEPVTLLAN